MCEHIVFYVSGIACLCKAEAETELTKLMVSDVNSGPRRGARVRRHKVVIGESVGVEELVADTQSCLK